MRRFLPLSLLLGACFPMHPHDMMSMNDPEEVEESDHDMTHMHGKNDWPVVRIDEPAGAHVKMDRGIFGDDIDVVAPFQASFQPTGWRKKSGYPLDFTLDEPSARLYGINHAVHLRGWLMVPEATRKKGIALISPSACELRALADGELQEIRIEAREMPTPAEVCLAATVAKTEHPAATCGQPRPKANQGDSWQNVWHGWMDHEGSRKNGPVAALVLRVAKDKK